MVSLPHAVLYGLIGLVCGVAAVHFGVQWTARAIRMQGRREKPRRADAAIVLGAFTHGFQPSRPLIARLRAALELYRRGYVSRIIVSGGRGEDETISEATSMKRFLVLNGVSPEAVLEDRFSRDTWENLRNSQQVMNHYGLQSAIVVTSDYHLPRALAVARQLGIDASGYAAWSPRRDLPYARREVWARLKYTLAGQAAI